MNLLRPSTLFGANRLSLLLALLGTWSATTTSQAWWDKEWTARKEFTLDTSAAAGDISKPVGDAVVLVRLHQGNFNFGTVKDDGSDLRFVAADDKTVLPSQIEKWDGLMNEAFVWVKLPEIKAGGQTKFFLYGGNGGELKDKVKSPFDGDAVVAYHFSPTGVPPTDSSENANNATSAGGASEGSMIGGGLRLLGNNAVSIPASATLNWTPGKAVTLSAWVKQGSLQPNAPLFSRKDGGNSFTIGFDQGVPYVEVADASGVKRSPAGTPVEVGAWKHLAVVSEGSTITLYLDGQSYAVLNAALPALQSASTLGGDGTGGLGFVGEVDEFEIRNAARTDGWVAFSSVNQSGSEKSTKMLVPGEDEGGEKESEIMKHFSLFGEIAHSLTFDGWVVIGLCSIMAVLGWAVAVQKFFYLNRVKKGADEFLKQWHHVASDLTLLDHNDAESIRSLGGKADSAAQELMHESPLYQIYHIGSEEIRHRVGADKAGHQGLSSRSIQAIRASLDGGLIREMQKLNGKLVFLTISIAGGPYLGLLGTVIGVMITFATIAKTGEVEVNSIAPGIAGALLATVAGLVVAIPALFAYSYLASRIKDTTSSMQMFIDEFVTKMAEFYPAKSDS